MVVTETLKIVVLPSGQYAAIDYTIDVGQMVMILILLAILIMQGVMIWTSRQSTH